MTLRTRMAFMVILLLLGCVFAAPYYRSAISQDQAASEPSLPTLQIQRSFQQSVEKSSDELTAAPTPKIPQHDAAQPKLESTRPSSGEVADSGKGIAVSASAPVLFSKPIPDLQMPTPNRGIRASSSKAPRTLSVKPVSLTGISSQSFGKNPTEPLRLASNFPAAESANKFPPTQSELPAVRSGADSGKLRATPMSQPPERSFGFRPNAISPAPKAEVQRHRVSRYDSLSEISKQYYGSGEHALLIFEANRDALVSPAILPIGLELIVPAMPNRTPQVQAWSANPTPHTPRSPEPPEKLPALPIENQFGWKRAQDDREWRD